jgi:hypothetical protein
MSDRDLLLAIAMALGGLSERLTGCSLQVRVGKDNGDYQKIILSGSSVEWLPTKPCSEPLNPHAAHEELHSRPDEADREVYSTH